MFPFRFVYSERIVDETTPQRAFSIGDRPSLGLPSSVRVHRFRETVSFAVGPRHELRLAQYQGKEKIRQTSHPFFFFPLDSRMHDEIVPNSLNNRSIDQSFGLIPIIGKIISVSLVVMLC